MFFEGPAKHIRDILSIGRESRDSERVDGRGRWRGRDVGKGERRCHPQVVGEREVLIVP